jgi:capsular polysaccharide biosynthesis protein
MSGSTKFQFGPIPLVVFVVLFLLVFLLVVISATLITFILPESFAGIARIKIEPVAATESQNIQTGYNPQFLQTEFEVLQSQLILDQAIDALDLNTVWGRKYQNGERLKTSETLALLKSRLALRPVRNTSLVEIRAFSEDRDEAAKIANAIARAYTDYAATKSNAMQVQILDSAHPAIRPVRPNKPLNIALGMVIGGVLGLGIGGLGAWVTVRLARKNRAATLSA